MTTLYVETAVRNPGWQLDYDWLSRYRLDEAGVVSSASLYTFEKCKIHDKVKTSLLLFAVSCMDITSLNGDDTEDTVRYLCDKAATPLQQSLLEALQCGLKHICTAAVCVYPARVANVVKHLRGTPGDNFVHIASVAGGFPSGQYGIKSKLLEIEYALENGANEIDVVINREYVLTENWKALYDELKQMRAACGSALMKTILSTGELRTFKNIFNASLVAMMAGTDFIKTSTGKEAVNAELPAGLVMIKAIREYHLYTKYMVGFKASGGVKTFEDAMKWTLLAKDELGPAWFNRNYFRIGASSLLQDIENELLLIVRRNALRKEGDSSKKSKCSECH